VYEGEWKYDVKEGYGILKNKDGEVLWEGEWKEDLPSEYYYLSV